MGYVEMQGDTPMITYSGDEQIEIRAYANNISEWSRGQKELVVPTLKEAAHRAAYLPASLFTSWA
jgi:hypothetical protein